jgi:hypothetical protein
MQTVKFDMSASNGQMKLSDDMLAMLQSSDVTTITEDMKVLSAYMFEQMTLGVVANIQNGLQSGITAMQEQTAGLEQGIAAMKKKASVPGMDAQIAGMTAAKDQMADLTDKMTQMKDAVPGAFETAKDDYLAQIDTLKPAIEKEYQRTLNIGFRQLYSTVAIVSALGLLILLFYKKKKDSSVVTE